MKYALFIAVVLIMIALSGINCTTTEQPPVPNGEQDDAVQQQAQPAVSLLVKPVMAPDTGVEEESQGSEGQNGSMLVIEKLEVFLRSGMEGTTVEIDPRSNMPQPKIEVKSLYTVEVISVAMSSKGEPLRYEWTCTGGKIYGSGNKITWLAPQAPIMYRITSLVTDSGGSACAAVDISVRCCY